ncbi:MAG: T9SS type A sorting domain-containing protein [Saprospiraceae bacterium]|nr:T9SS type A sorting domain-containing protein [Saprospiraceae bacterium]
MDSKIILRNTSGSQIFRFSLKNPSENSFTLPVENLQPGLYLINILNGDQSCYGRFIKI